MYFALHATNFVTLSQFPKFRSVGGLIFSTYVPTLRYTDTGVSESQTVELTDINNKNIFTK